MNTATPPHPAPAKYAGWACPVCQQTLVAGASIVECATCGAPHHTVCWTLGGTCRAYECKPASSEVSASAPRATADRSASAPRATADRSASTPEEQRRGKSAAAGQPFAGYTLMEKPPEPAPDEAAGGPAGGAPGAGHGIIIKPGDVKSVEIEEVSVRSGPTVQPLRIARFVEKRTSRMAVASLILGITGLFLAGVPGVFAAVTGAIALGAILNDRRLKGALWAVVGIGLGVTAVTGWLAVAILYFWAPERGRGSPPVQFAAGPALLRFDDAPPEIRKLLQASVHITGSSRAGLAGHREWLGSGVIYRSGGDEAILLTNRHVADPAFADGRGGDRAAEAELQVTYFSGETVKAKVDWIAPAGIDIALLRCPPPVGGATLVPFDPVRTVRISDMVFAIGNPEGLGWSYTQGPISGIRTYSSEGEEVIVLQTQAALNPGNSGGGLFDREGFLIGINTWTQDKRVAEGLNFAISMETVDRILRAAGKARQ